MEHESQHPSLSPGVDRATPRIAINPRWQHFGIAGITVGAMLLIAVMVMQEARSKENPQRGAAEETFRINPSQEGKPYIAPSPQSPEAHPARQAAGEPAYDPQEAQRLAMLQQEAIRSAQERQKKLQQRLYSNQLVIDTPTGSTGAEITPAQQAVSLETSGGTLLGGTSDENLQFAKERQNTGAETVGAVQMQNLYGLIPQGTMISGVLETAIKSNLPGMVRAIVSEDVYSFDKSNLLIPSGSTLVGQYRSAVRQGQSRVFVIWDRLIRPDGVSVDLASYGTDSLGRSGMEGDVDTHFMERFGSSILLSMIDAGVRIGVEKAGDKDTANVVVSSGDDFSNASEIALKNSIGIPSTVDVDQGERIKVFVGRDLDFSTVKQTAWRD